TSIVFYSPSAGNATIKIFTITGRLVKTFSVTASSGSNEILWDGKNGRGQVVRNGVYVAVIMSPGGSKQMVKIAVVK
ncbi:MAG: FlgD immunoglobulin-like domain containing protein, partial [Spirochaetota bacterium]